MEEQKQKPEVKNPALKLMNKLRENRRSLYIARVPDKTKEAFEKLAEDDFCGDYGMLLKWLMDDMFGQDIKVVMGVIHDHEARLQLLEAKRDDKEPEEEVKRMLDGTKKVVTSRE